MATPKELRQALVEARAELQAALHEAHAKWEVNPPSSEGEEAWSPKQVAQHVIGAELYFASGVAQACGAPPLERQMPDVSTPGSAAASLTRFAATADNVLRHVSDADLSKTHTLRLGELTVEQMLTVVASHAQDHARQIRTASS